MNALIVYAHHEPRSFNAAMKDRALGVLTANGWHAEVSDLYAEGFAAAAGRADFTRPTASERFGYVHEQRHAAASRRYAGDILREQDRLARADLVLLQFPLWWYAPPAILKGWADRVLTHGFAYTDTELFDTGLLRGKRSMLAVTTGGTREELHADSAVTGTVDEILRPISGGVLRYVGMDVAPAFVAYAPASLDPAGRSNLLDAYEAQLQQVLDGCCPDAGGGRHACS